MMRHFHVLTWCTVVACTLAVGCGKKQQKADETPAEAPAGAEKKEPAGPYDLEQLDSADGLRAIDSSCTGEWEPVADLRTQSMIVDELTQLWTDGRITSHPPINCQLRVFRRCAPDMNADGEPEALVRVLWQIHMDMGVGIPCDDLETTETAAETHFVVDARAIMSPDDGWKLQALYDHTFPGYQDSRDPRTVEEFVEFPNGSMGFRGPFERQNPSEDCVSSGAFVQTFDFERWHPDDVATREFVAQTDCP